MIIEPDVRENRKLPSTAEMSDRLTAEDRQKEKVFSDCDGLRRIISGACALTFTGVVFPGDDGVSNRLGATGTGTLPFIAIGLLFNRREKRKARSDASQRLFGVIESVIFSREHGKTRSPPAGDENPGSIRCGRSRRMQRMADLVKDAPG